MRRYRYAVGALLGLLLTILAVVVVAVRAEEMPRIVNLWPLVLAVGVSVLAWWLQGLISALLARPQLSSLRVRDMTRIYLAGAFIGGISPIRGAEIPYEIYLLKRLGLSVGEGSTVILTKGLLNVGVMILGTLGGVVFSGELPKVGSWKLLAAALAVGGIWALVAFLVRRIRSRSAASGVTTDSEVKKAQEAGWRAKISFFFRDMWGSFARLWRRGCRPLLLYSSVLMALYWAVRLSFGPLALMAAGWSGDWVPVVLAQLFISSFVLPLVPTPGGSGAVELSFAAFLSAYATQSELLSGIIIYAGLTHYLPTVVGAFFTGRQLWQGVARGE
jgi:glycosyltransferase 2 family protein